jgi:hypothetical protein
MFADLVASWVRDERERRWLAPRGAGPLTAADVRGWAGPGHQPMMMVPVELPGSGRPFPVVGSRSPVASRRFPVTSSRFPVSGCQTPDSSDRCAVSDRRPAASGDRLSEVRIHTPLAYGELNVLSASQRRYWLGHLIVDPHWRGRGMGVELTRLLTRRAFELHGASQVTLIVYPENEAAIRCYRAAGFQPDGYEAHDFTGCGESHTLLRMSIYRV